MKTNNKKYPEARYDFDTNPQVYGFKVGKTYRFRDFGRGIEVFYGDGDSGIMYNDPDLAIKWPMELIGGEQNLIISEKDTHLMSLKDYCKSMAF